MSTQKEALEEEYLDLCDYMIETDRDIRVGAEDYESVADTINQWERRIAEINKILSQWCVYCDKPDENALCSNELCWQCCGDGCKYHDIDERIDDERAKRKA